MKKEVKILPESQGNMEQSFGFDDPAEMKHEDADIVFDDASTTVLDDTKKQLEDLQLRTIYTLVENVQVTFAQVPYICTCTCTLNLNLTTLLPGL